MNTAEVDQIAPFPWRVTFSPVVYDEDATGTWDITDAKGIIIFSLFGGYHECYKSRAEMIARYIVDCCNGAPVIPQERGDAIRSLPAIREALRGAK